MGLLTPDLGYFFWIFVAFVVVFLVLKKFAWKPIIKSLNEREQNIAGAIASAEKVKAEMAQLQSENESLLAKAREERAQLLKEARETKDKIVNEAKEQAKAEASKIIADAQQAINAQKMAALTDVKNEVGKMVIEVSEKVLKQQLAGADKQEAYINSLVNSIKLN
ncbi:F0F1 ATP synthase subunit B [Niabella drilacis]|uniref:ATP synthase subunit b n=1 Tax=Niabella drilacis (strain DSM 25811 / CCM 8410 / CCUG 62505 / LMG 26954 / E90) TaxID=1285928 RepID=A0A1G6YQX2_NIADE|nr:F0F1 ATP synthase subunit B [Niabella drilacis]SDD92768.1 F-type H+-transporting ATPase subunit b [Niabella drilacis]